MFDFNKKNNNVEKIENKEIEYDLNFLDSKFKKKELELGKLEKKLNDFKIFTKVEINNLNKKISNYKNKLKNVEEYYWKSFIEINDCVDEIDFEIELAKIQDKRKDIIKSNKAFNYVDSICVTRNENFEKLIFRALSKEFDIIKNNILKHKSELYKKELNTMINFYSDICINNYFEIDSVFIDTYTNECQLYIDYIIYINNINENIKNEIKANKRRIEIKSIRNKFNKELNRCKTNINSYKEKILKEKNNNKLQDLKQKLNKIESHLQYLDEKNKYIEYQENKIKSGYIYVLSNKLSFGEDVFKICLTNNLFPFKEINKLNTNSTPYEFTIDFIYLVDDIETIKKDVFNHFKNRIIRKINDYDSFYRCSKEEITKFIENININKQCI